MTSTEASNKGMCYIKSYLNQEGNDAYANVQIITHVLLAIQKS